MSNMEKYIADIKSKVGTHPQFGGERQNASQERMILTCDPQCLGDMIVSETSIRGRRLRKSRISLGRLMLQIKGSSESVEKKERKMDTGFMWFDPNVETPQGPHLGWPGHPGNSPFWLPACPRTVQPISVEFEERAGEKLDEDSGKQGWLGRCRDSYLQGIIQVKENKLAGIKRMIGHTWSVNATTTS
ncbi:uncharacterized protein J3R85_015674 [Psidium guajava]|nr:uncharacterized protein J3R85_015674 [Psidium guajava]